MNRPASRSPTQGRPVIVLGGGGHAKVVIDTLLAAGATVIGLCDPALAAGTIGALGTPVLGGDEALDGTTPAEIYLANGVGSTCSTEPRRAVFERAKARGFEFATVIHPSAVIGREVILEEGAQVMAGAVVQPGAVLGRNCLVNTGARIDHDCQIGAHVHIAPGVTFCGNVRAGEGAHIGSGHISTQEAIHPPGIFIVAGTVASSTGEIWRGVPSGHSARPNLPGKLIAPHPATKAKS